MFKTKETTHYRKEVIAMNQKELKKLMETRMVQVEMSEAEVLFWHAVATLGDGRHTLTKFFRKRITPVALKILEERKEYH